MPGSRDHPSGTAVRPRREVRRVWWALAGATVVLTSLSLLVPALVHHPLTRGRGEVRLYLDVLEEGNLPSWWSVALLTVGGVLHLLLAWLSSTSGAQRSWPWAVTGTAQLLLSLDDATSLHERLQRVGGQVVDLGTYPFPWLVLGAPIAGSFVAAVVVCSRQLPRRQGLMLVAGILTLFTGAVGLELVSGLVLQSWGPDGAYAVLYHLEELVENAGALLLVAAAVTSVHVRRAGAGVVVVPADARTPAR